MTKEIEILLQAARKGCAAVEKDTHRLWDQEEIAEAAQSGRFPAEDRLDAPSPQLEINSPFPGCIQQWGAADRRYRLVGQTRHFLIFIPPRTS